MEKADMEEDGETNEMEMADVAEEGDKEEVAKLAGTGEEMEMAEEAEKANEAEEIEMAEGIEGADEEVEDVDTNASGTGKRKRGKNVKSHAKVPSKKKMEEDVCFICFDGGNLVLCDRRGCPKAYHPACVNRDEAFFRAKGRWNCGNFLLSSSFAFFISLLLKLSLFLPSCGVH
uniref:Zinc finger PHD-type domain-containing protein n=1 Tax=Rhizophora mucronata TaxID=61149 RepID=A0A2P2KIN2_RHIMU